MGLGGCAGIHLGATDVTGSTATSGVLAYGSGDPSDWDLIRSTVASSLSAPADARIEWRNPATGNSGTISGLAVAENANGLTCRGFSSTIAGIDGVRLYKAEICKSVMKTWEFARIEPADGKDAK